MKSIFSKILVGVGVVLAVPMCQGMINLGDHGLSVSMPISTVLERLGVSCFEGSNPVYSVSSRGIQIEFAEAFSFEQLATVVSIPREIKVDVSVERNRTRVLVSLPSPNSLAGNLYGALPGGWEFNAMRMGVPPSPRTTVSDNLFYLTHVGSYASYQRNALNARWTQDVLLVRNHFGKKFNATRLKAILMRAEEIAIAEGNALEKLRPYLRGEVAMVIFIGQNRERLAKIFSSMPSDFGLKKEVEGDSTTGDDTFAEFDGEKEATAES
jgi:hypothetical protein